MNTKKQHHYFYLLIITALMPVKTFSAYRTLLRHAAKASTIVVLPAARKFLQEPNKPTNPTNTTPPDTPSATETEIRKKLKELEIRLKKITPEAGGLFKQPKEEQNKIRDEMRELQIILSNIRFNKKEQLKEILKDLIPQQRLRAAKFPSQEKAMLQEYLQYEASPSSQQTLQEHLFDRFKNRDDNLTRATFASSNFNPYPTIFSEHFSIPPYKDELQEQVKRINAIMSEKAEEKKLLKLKQEHDLKQRVNRALAALKVGKLVTTPKEEERLLKILEKRTPMSNNIPLFDPNKLPPKPHPDTPASSFLYNLGEPIKKYALPTTWAKKIPNQQLGALALGATIALGSAYGVYKYLQRLRKEEEEEEEEKTHEEPNKNLEETAELTTY